MLPTTKLAELDMFFSLTNVNNRFYLYFRMLPASILKFFFLKQ